MSEIVITPLGTISPYTKGNMNCPGFLVEYNNKKILLDCGNGITRLLNFPEDLKDLSVIITHYHKEGCWLSCTLRPCTMPPARPGRGRASACSLCCPWAPTAPSRRCRYKTRRTAVSGPVTSGCWPIRKAAKRPRALRRSWTEKISTWRPGFPEPGARRV